MPNQQPVRVRDAVGVWCATAKPAPWLAIGLAGAGVLLVTMGQDRDNKVDWALLITGVVLGVVGAVIQHQREAWRRRLEQAEHTEAERFRVAVQDAFQPVAELIAGMPSMGRAADREARLDQVCEQAVGALKLLLPDVDRLRTVIYGLNEAADCMSYRAYHGRGGGGKPRPFEKGTERGDLALKMVADGGNLFVPDLGTEAVPVEYHGSRVGYRTFISASISTGETAFGMVTVDAPTAGDLVSTDQQIVMLMADLLAIAFAEVAR